MKLRFARWLLCALAVLVVLTLPASAQTKTLYWDRFDVDITVNRDGTFDVAETQTIVFTNGTFTFGFRSIPTDKLESLSDIVVEDEWGAYVLNDSQTPGTYSVSVEGSSVVIRWYFDEAQDESRTWTIRYKVHGGLRYYDEGDQIWWQAVYADRSFPVNHSVVTIHVPPPAEIINFDSYFTEAELELVDPQTVRLTAKDRIPPQQAFEVRAQFTAGVVAGSPAPWQAAEDARAAELEKQAEYDRTWRPVVNLLVGAFSILFLILAPLGLYLIWYTRGRDAQVDFKAEYLPEPPSDLPPGMVGTLLDERADLQDILATLVDLARKGYIQIEELEAEKKGLFGWGETDFRYTRLKEPDDKLRDYESVFMQALFEDEEARKLSDLKEKFYAYLPDLKRRLYEEVVEEGLFVADPERTRNRWAMGGVVALLVSFVFGCVSTVALATYSDVAMCLPVGFGVFSVGLIVLARFMPRKTKKGADLAARWDAFRTYLRKIDQYTDLERASELFERYLPYAIAFGLEQEYIRTWSKVPQTPVPTWYSPYPRPVYQYGGASESSFGGETAAGQELAGAGAEGAGAGRGGREGKGGIPSLGEASRGMSAGLAGMSAGLSRMLSSASRTLTSRPQPSGGTGWSASRGSFGGGG
ncbi:MAG: DUF2207 domain-containing protein, partial [Caldilineae bacterium]